VLVEGAMFAYLARLLLFARSRISSRASLDAENLILRQRVILIKPQVPVAGAAAEHRSGDLRLADRCFAAIQNVITLAKPESLFGGIKLEDFRSGHILKNIAEHKTDHSSTLAQCSA
jgi:hypothetical protein